MDALLTDKRNVGIRIIVAAEKEAQQIVHAARTGKYFQLLQVQSHAWHGVPRRLLSSENRIIYII